MMHRIITPKRVVAATVAACLAVVSVVGILGYQTYDKVRAEAITEFELANTLEATKLDNLDALLAEANAQIASAEALYAGTEGKTLSNDERGVLADDILAAKEAVAKAEAEAENVAEAFAEAGEAFDAKLWWPDNALALAHELREMITSLSADIESALRRVTASSEKVQTAQAAWQAEQDRIAAEAAKKAAEDAAKAAEAAAQAAKDRMSKPPTIPSGSTLTPTGGATAPTAPAAPPPAVTQQQIAAVPSGFTPDSYMASFARGVAYFVDYTPGLCDGLYVCGRTWVADGVTPVIELDSNPDVMAIYGTDIGKYVLVHEVAHVLQYYSYGQTVEGMRNKTSTFAVKSGRVGDDAVEYMADCSTIVRLRYALTPVTWPYTSGCLAEEYAAARLIW